MLEVCYNLISYLNCVSHIIGYESSVAAVLFNYDTICDLF